MEADPNCPRCKALEPIIRRITRELDIPFQVKYLSTKAVAAYEESVAEHTMSRHWIEAFGTKDHKKKLEKIGPILDYFERIGARTFPVLIIRWHDGVRPREIVIRGFANDDADRFKANIYTLLRILRRSLYGA